MQAFSLLLFYFLFGSRNSPKKKLTNTKCLIRTNTVHYWKNNLSEAFYCVAGLWASVFKGQGYFRAQVQYSQQASNLDICMYFGEICIKNAKIILIALINDQTINWTELFSRVILYESVYLWFQIYNGIKNSKNIFEIIGCHKSLAVFLLNFQLNCFNCAI